MKVNSSFKEDSLGLHNNEWDFVDTILLVWRGRRFIIIGGILGAILVALNYAGAHLLSDEKRLNVAPQLSTYRYMIPFTVNDTMSSEIGEYEYSSQADFVKIVNEMFVDPRYLRVFFSNVESVTHAGITMPLFTEGRGEILEQYKQNQKVGKIVPSKKNDYIFISEWPFLIDVTTSAKAIPTGLNAMIDTFNADIKDTSNRMQMITSQKINERMAIQVSINKYLASLDRRIESIQASNSASQREMMELKPSKYSDLDRAAEMLAILQVNGRISDNEQKEIRQNLSTLFFKSQKLSKYDLEHAKNVDESSLLYTVSTNPGDIQKQGNVSNITQNDAKSPFKQKQKYIVLVMGVLSGALLGLVAFIVKDFFIANWQRLANGLRQ